METLRGRYSLLCLLEGHRQYVNHACDDEGRLEFMTGYSQEFIHAPCGFFLRLHPLLQKPFSFFLGFPALGDVMHNNGKTTMSLKEREKGSEIGIDQAAVFLLMNPYSLKVQLATTFHSPYQYIFARRILFCMSYSFQ